MKNIQITLQPLSLIVGAALLGITLITTGAFAPQGSSTQRDINYTQIIEGSWMRIDSLAGSGQTTYVVPTGKAFVVTSYSCGDCNGISRVELQRPSGMRYWFQESTYSWFVDYPDRNIVAMEGDLVVAFSACGSEKTWITGYLVDA
jgi:hypothetical protein